MASHSPSRVTQVPRGRLMEAAVASGVAGLLGVALSRLVNVPSMSRAVVLGAFLLPLVVLAFGQVERVLLAVIILDIPLQVDVNLFYRSDAASVGALGGLPISVTTVALACLYGMWVAEAVLRPDGAVKPRLRSSAPLLAFLAINVASIVVAGDRELAGFGVAMLSQCVLVYLYVATHVRSERDTRFVVAMLVSALLLEAIALIVLWTGHSFPLAKGSFAGTGNTATRYGGTVGGPNVAAAFVAGLLAPALALVATPVCRALKLLAVAAFLLGSVGLAITGSRGGTIGLGISLVVLAALGLRGGWLRAPHVFVGMLVVGLAFLPVLSLATARFTTDDKGAAQSRAPLNRLAGDIFRAHPVLGVGANNVGVEMKRIAGPEYSGDWIYTVHNKYLLVAAEAGIGGLAAFVWFLASTVRRGARAASRGGLFVAPVTAGLTAALLGQLVHMSVEIYQGRPQVQLLALVAGLLTAMAATAAPHPPVRFIPLKRQVIAA